MFPNKKIDSLIRESKEEEALELFEKYLVEFPNDIDKKIEYAIYLSHSPFHDDIGALEIIDEILSNDPTNVKALVVKGKMEDIHQIIKDETLELFNQFLERHHERDEYYGEILLLKAFYFMTFERYVEAEEILQKSIIVSPNFSLNYKDLGYIFQKRDDVVQAKYFYEMALKNIVKVCYDGDEFSPYSFNQFVEEYIQGIDVSDINYNRLVRKVESLKNRVKKIKPKKALPPEIEVEEYIRLAREYKQRGEYHKAIEFQKEVLAVTAKFSGVKNLHTASSYNSLALLYAEIEEYNESLKLQQKSLEITQELLEENHPDTATNYFNLARLYHKMGDYNRSLELHQKALNIRVELLGKAHIETYYSFVGMIKLFITLEQYKSASDFLLKIIDTVEKVKPKDIYLANLYDDLGILSYELEEYDSVLPLLEKALELKKEWHGENHLTVAMSYSDIGGFHYRVTKEYSLAYGYMEKALKIRKKFLPETHELVVEMVEALEVLDEKI